MSGQKAGSERRFVIGISGASGAVYAKRLVEALVRAPDCYVDLTWTSAGLRVMNDELERAEGPSGRNEGATANAADAVGRTAGGAAKVLEYFDLNDEERARVTCHATNDIGAGPASGTYPVEAMVVVPASLNTVASIAHGLQPNLLTRAAAVTLKEGRPLVLVPRETPLGLIELRNLATAAEAGAIVLPASPGFYHHPATVEDLVDFIVQKILDRLKVEAPEPVRWGINVREGGR